MGSFKEARDGILEFQDMDVETFDVLMHWVFTGQFDLPGDFEEDCEANHQRNISILVDVVSWADRWLFEEKHYIMQTAMSTLVDKLNVNINRLTPQAIDAAFSSGSDTLKAIIAQCCVIPFVQWTEDPESDFAFEQNVNHTPDFMR